MGEWIKQFESIWFPNLLGTLILLSAVIGFRALAIRALVRREALPFDRRRRRLITIRNLAALITVIGLITIWAKELRPFALSLLAVAVAVVIATKELIMSLTGGLLNAGSQIYTVGDRIEVNGVRGDVIDKNLLTTRILELGPGSTSHQYTGRTISMPNTMLLDNPVHCESLTDAYIIQVMSIPLAANDDWKRGEALLLEIARTECGPYQVQAQQHLNDLETKEWIEVPSAEPRVTLRLRDPNSVTLLLRIPSPARRQRVVQQRILHEFLERYYVGEPKPASEPAPTENQGNTPKSR